MTKIIDLDSKRPPKVEMRITSQDVENRLQDLNLDRYLLIAEINESQFWLFGKLKEEDHEGQSLELLKRAYAYVASELEKRNETGSTNAPEGETEKS